MQPSRRGSARDAIELVLGYGFILVVIWLPEPLQRILSPFALLFTLSVVLIERRAKAAEANSSREGLGFGWRDFVRSFWILPAATGFSLLSMLLARRFGILHPLYKGDFVHIAGYVLWTIYQQFLLQDYFVVRLSRVLPNPQAVIAVAGILFAAAHLPNMTLTIATLVWGVFSCALFRRCRSIYALGLAQGILGLCFAICVPDALHHHMRVGLGYLTYHSTQPVP